MAMRTGGSQEARRPAPDLRQNIRHAASQQDIHGRAEQQEIYQWLEIHIVQQTNIRLAANQQETNPAFFATNPDGASG